MIKVDLITGFLGSGKTTFIKKYVRFLNDQGIKICILENDYGAVNVDVALLEDIRSDMCGVEMIVGGDGRDAHQRRLKTKLITLAMSGYQRVIIEPSGIFDMDEFFDTLYESPLDNWYEIGSVIAIASADLEDNLSEDADYVLASEIADAGIVVLSKTEDVSDEQITKVKEHIRTALLGIGVKRQDIFRSAEAFDNFFINKKADGLSDDDFRRIASAGYVHGDYEKKQLSMTGSGALGNDGGSFSNLYLFGVTLTKDELISSIDKAINDPKCGHIIRIKGFAKDGAKGYIEVNATREKLSINHISNAQEVIIVIGENLSSDKINNYFPTADFENLLK
jgi:G3E family GTPase